MEIELSVIIVNYNGERFLKGCLESLHEKLTGINHEIIIVDNNSSDNSCSFIKHSFPGVILIESKTNLGFGKGNNKGVKYAKGKYLLLINNDTIVLDRLLPVIDILKQDSNIGAAGIKMLDAQHNYLLSAGRFPKLFTLIRLKNLGNLGSEFETGLFVQQRYDVDWITGSFIMMPTAVYKGINGFDEDYFMYVEDVDLCKRIADKGFRRVFLPEYAYVHFVGYNKSKDHHIIKGWSIFVGKHYKAAKKICLTASLNINKAIKKIKALVAFKAT